MCVDGKSKMKIERKALTWARSGSANPYSDLSASQNLSLLEFQQDAERCPVLLNELAKPQKTLMSICTATHFVHKDGFQINYVTSFFPDLFCIILLSSHSFSAIESNSLIAFLYIKARDD
jgi:hypothetical protein